MQPIVTLGQCRSVGLVARETSMLTGCYSQTEACVIGNSILRLCERWRSVVALFCPIDSKRHMLSLQVKACFRLGTVSM